jgi:hypothetical protein
MSSNEDTNLSKNTKYKKFIKARDELLEKFLRKAHLQITAEMDNAFISIIGIVKGKYQDVMKMSLPISHKVKHFERDLDRIFDLLGINIIPILLEMRRKTTLLTRAGEAEAIYQATGMPIIKKTNEHDIATQALKLFDPESALHKKVNLALSKLKRIVLNELETGITMDFQVDKTVGLIFLKLPKKKLLPEKTKALRPVKTREASDRWAGTHYPFKPSLFTGDTWGAVLEDYERDYVPEIRGPEVVFDIKNPWNDEPIRSKIEGEDAIYGWEVGKDITHDFVKEVRAGQVDTANLNGITDFVWIAVLDDKTCEKCCEWRDGLTSSEIEDKLKANKDLAEYCDAIAAPAHMNCRCSMAPVVKELGTYDTTDTEKDFEQWLYPNN